MVKKFNYAIRDAIFAIDRPFVDIAARVGVHRQRIYLITQNDCECHKMLRKNADAFMEYLNPELDNKIRQHVREVKRLKQIKDDLAESYTAIYIDKKKKRKSDHDTLE